MFNRKSSTDVMRIHLDDTQEKNLSSLDENGLGKYIL